MTSVFVPCTDLPVMRPSSLSRVMPASASASLIARTELSSGDWPGSSPCGVWPTPTIATLPRMSVSMPVSMVAMSADHRLPAVDVQYGAVDGRGPLGRDERAGPGHLGRRRLAADRDDLAGDLVGPLAGQPRVGLQVADGVGEA